MNYNYLRYFSVLAQVEHYTLAAARLGISQPSLSSAIHNLETELGGVQLFEKVGRNIRLTEEGRFYKEQVDEALNQLQNAAATLQESMVSAPVMVRMGYISGTLDEVVAEKIRDYAKRNPRVRFQLTEGASQELMDLVRQEKLDMALVDTTNRDRTLHFRKLYERDYFVAVRRGSALAEKEKLLPQDILGEPQIGFNYEPQDVFGQWASGVTPEENTICSVNTAQGALRLVEAGLGLCVLPHSCVDSKHSVRFLPLANRHQALYMCILYDKWLEPPVWGFVEELVKAIRKANP